MLIVVSCGVTGTEIASSYIIAASSILDRLEGAALQHAKARLPFVRICVPQPGPFGKEDNRVNTTLFSFDLDRF
jgi:hypothetical protein